MMAWQMNYITRCWLFSPNNIGPNIFLDFLGIRIDVFDNLTDFLGCWLDSFGVFIALFVPENGVTEGRHRGDLSAEVKGGGVGEGLPLLILLTSILLQCSINQGARDLPKLRILSYFLINSRPQIFVCVLCSGFFDWFFYEIRDLSLGIVLQAGVVFIFFDERIELELSEREGIGGDLWVGLPQIKLCASDICATQQTDENTCFYFHIYYFYMIKLAVDQEFGTH